MAQPMFKPDSGAQVSVATRSYAAKLGIDIKKLHPVKGRLRAWDGKVSVPDGKVDVVFTVDGVSTMAAIWIAKGVRDPVLSAQVSHRLGLMNFPKHEVQVVSSSESDKQGVNSKSASEALTDADKSVGVKFFSSACQGPEIHPGIQTSGGHLKLLGRNSSLRTGSVCRNR